MDRKIIIEVCRFAMDRYGDGVKGDIWRKRMYYLSPLSIAKLYLKEFVGWRDMRRWQEKTEVGNDSNNRMDGRNVYLNENDRNWFKKGIKRLRMFFHYRYIHCNDLVNDSPCGKK